MSWLDRWLYEMEPVMGYQPLQGQLSVPDPRWNKWGEEPDTGALAVPPSGPQPQIDMSGGYSDVPVQVGEQRTGKKTALGRALLDILPRMAESAIAGGATQNVAGGGPTDFFRAATAGREAFDRRDANQLLMQQQYDRRRQQEELARSQQAENLAQADLYRAQMEKVKRTPAPQGFAEKYAAAYEQLIKNNVPPAQAAAQAAIIGSGGSLQHIKPTDPHADMVRVTRDHPSAQNVAPSINPQTGEEEYWIPKQWQDRSQNQKPQQPRPPQMFHYPGPNNTMNVVTMGADGKLEEKVLKNQTAPKAVTGARSKAGPKGPTRAQYLGIERKKRSSLEKAEQATAKAVEKAQTAAGDRQALINKAYADLEETKKRIQQDYLQDIAILQATIMDKQDAAAEKEAAAAEKATGTKRSTVPAWAGHGFK